MAKLHNIPTSQPASECARLKRLPKRFEDGVVLETTGIRNNSDNYKIDLHYPVLDSFLSELKRRFTDKNKDIMRALQACYPTSRNFLDTTHLNPLIVTYDLDLEALIMETQVAKRTLARKELEDISDVLMELAPLKLAFPTVVKLLQIAMTVCVSTAKCERSFSALKRIKTYLRSSMSKQRLTDMAILSIERDLADSLILSNVVDVLARKSRRIALC